MKPETADRLTAAFEQGIRRVSDGQTAEEAIEEVIRFLNGILAHLERTRSMERVREMLLQAEEPSPLTVRMIEGTIRHFPRIFHGHLKSSFLSYLKANRDTGRPESIPQDQHRSICDAVLVLIGTGMTATKAIRQIARRNNVNSRTIDRIWKRRADIPHDNVTSQQAEAFIAELLRPDKH